VRVSHYKHVNVVQQSDLAVLEQPTLTDGIFQLAIDWLQAYGTHYTDWLVTLELGALRPPWNETEYLDPRSQEAGGTDTESDDPSAAPPQFDYQDCGDPEPPPERFGWKNAYAGTLQYVDDLLGQFLTLLKELGIDQECLISVTSFRGQSLGERSSVPRRSQGLYEERIHLPLILRFPGSVGAGRRIHHLTQPVDWFATLAEAFDIKEDLWPRQIPRHSPLRFGPHHSLWRFSQGHGGRPREYVMIEGSPGHKLQEVAVRTPGWYWIMPRGGALGPVQLYRKPEDRWDMNNVLKEHPDVADHLELTWYRYQDWLESGQEGDPPQLRDDVLKGVES
jgi:arylsulfatase A-like enzyme